MAQGDWAYGGGGEPGRWPQGGWDQMASLGRMYGQTLAGGMGPGAGPSFQGQSVQGGFGPYGGFGQGYQAGEYGHSHPMPAYGAQPYSAPGYAYPVYGPRGYAPQGYAPVARTPAQAYGYAGAYAGRGPRGYHRSDDRICDDINEALTRSPDLDATDIEVIVEEGEVVLIGIVDSRQAKRLAEDLADSVGGVSDVQNQIRVQRGADMARAQEGTRQASDSAGQSTPAGGGSASTERSAGQGASSAGQGASAGQSPSAGASQSASEQQAAKAR
jgi:hypothetical protein